MNTPLSNTSGIGRNSGIDHGEDGGDRPRRLVEPPDQAGLRPLGARRRRQPSRGRSRPQRHLASLPPGLGGERSPLRWTDRYQWSPGPPAASPDANLHARRKAMSRSVVTSRRMIHRPVESGHPVGVLDDATTFGARIGATQISGAWRTS
jgi:hypothetical protein